MHIEKVDNDIDSLTVALTQSLAGLAPGADSKRLVHGRGKTIPGCEQVSVDWFEPVLLITLYAPVNVTDWLGVLKPILEPFEDLIQGVLVQRRYQSSAPMELVLGSLPEVVRAKRGDLRFELSFFKQQNVGFFLDMEPGRAWLEQHSKGKKVLNLFAFTCAFSVVAAKAQAQMVVNVDLSSPALATGRHNHRINGLEQCSVFYLQENILKSWSRIRKHGPYDIVIFDPPSFQKGSFVATRDYQKLIRRIPQLCSPKADILACLNAPELESSFIETLFHQELEQPFALQRLAAHPDFSDVDPERALKLIHCRYG